MVIVWPRLSFLTVQGGGDPRQNKGNQKDIEKLRRQDGSLQYISNVDGDLKTAVTECIRPLWKGILDT